MIRPPMTSGSTLPARARRHGERVALRQGAEALSYAQLHRDAARIASALLAGRDDLEEERIAFLVAPSFDYVRLQWGIWMAGGIAVPLCTSHPPPELDYVLADAVPERVVAAPQLAERVEAVARARSIAVGTVADLTTDADAELPAVGSDRRAMMVYTSGTTGGPKGVVSTHGNLEAQIGALEAAWAWTPDDAILLTLPLHHVHGIVNVVGCALSSGASCRLHPAFDAHRTWEALAGGGLTLFMGVPTMYYRLIRAWEEADEGTRRRWSDGASRLRLMVSGSAALPETVLEEWRRITGHTLLERYGMTETGMILSNPLTGDRIPGAVGQPLPGVEVQLVDDDGPVAGAGEGEVWVRGPAVFAEYWRRPEATRDAFVGDWFRTGVTYRLLGRSSVDIIKTGGYKVSALEIEETLRRHPAVGDCAVVGVADPEWGERVVAAAVAAGAAVDDEELRAWAKERLAAYKVPREVRWLPDLPRNALGKVTKPAVQALFDAPAETR